MGQLTPGATYIYERDGKKVYARESGKTERRLIGYDYDTSGQNLAEGLEQYQRTELWLAILQEARTNPTLQAELDRVIIVYNLLKKDHR